MLLAITGFAIILLMVYLIMSDKATPMTTFIVLPLVGALVCGFSLNEIGGFVKAGMNSVMGMAVLFVFVITFFGVMSDAGMFDIVVAKLTKMAGSNVIGVLVVVAIVSFIGSLDGNSATTYLITYPALLPVCQRLGIRIKAAALCACVPLGIMNLLPWGGTVTRSAAVMGLDATELWKILIPTQVFGLMCALLICVVVGRIEMKRGAGSTLVNDSVTSLFGASSENKAESESLKRPQFLVVNWALTIAIIAIIMFTKLPAYLPFMIGCVIGLTINYPSLELQKQRWLAHSSSVVTLVATTLAASVLVGVLNKSGMILAMAKAVISILPASWGPHLHVFFGAFGGAIGLGVAADPYYYGLLPIILEVMKQFNVDPQSVALSMVIGQTITTPVSPVIPSMFLGLALSGLELKEHMRFSFMTLWGTSLVMLAFALLTGAVHF